MPQLGGTFGTRVTIDSVRLSQFMRSSDGPVLRKMLEAGDIVKAGAQRRVGVWSPSPGEPGWSIARRIARRRPGTLRDSIVKRVVEGSGDRPFTVVVGSEDRIALWHHEGTEPHTISAGAKPKLVFWWSRGAQVVRVEQVRHPGTRPNRYLTESLADLRGFF